MFIEKNTSCQAENGLEVTRVKEKQQVMDLFQHSKQGVGLAALELQQSRGTEMSRSRNVWEQLQFLLMMNYTVRQGEN